MYRRLSAWFGFGVLVAVLIFFVTQTINKPSAQNPQVELTPAKTWIDFELPKTNGVTWSSTSLGNQAVVLNFWAPWCLPCRHEVPYLIELHMRYGSDFKFIGIAIDQPHTVRQYEDEVGLNYLSLVDDSKGVELLQYYQSSGLLPLTLVFDKHRNMRHQVLGPLNPKDFEQILKEML